MAETGAELYKRAEHLWHEISELINARFDMGLLEGTGEAYYAKGKVIEHLQARAEAMERRAAELDRDYDPELDLLSDEWEEHTRDMRDLNEFARGR